MKIEVTIESCRDCRYIDHSGSFTPGGARTICNHPDVIEIVGEIKKIFKPNDYIKHLNNQKSPLYKAAENYIHWEHRVIEKTIPEWCPLKHGKPY